MKEKLQVGLLIEDVIIPAWTYEMFSKIAYSSSADIVLVIKRNSTPQRKNYRHFVYNFYNKFDTKYFKPSPNALQNKEVNSLLDVEVVNESEIDVIKKHNIDILVYTGFRPLEGEILDIAKYGIWSFHYGNSKYYNGVPQTFWEVIERKNEMNISLYALVDGQSSVLETLTTLPDNLSITRCKNNCFWKAAAILPRNIDELYLLGAHDFFYRIKNSDKNIAFYNSEIQTIPSNIKALYNLFSFNWKRLTNIIGSFFYFDQWILLFKFDQSGSISTDFSLFKKIIPPKDRFWADPHVVKKNDIYYIFIEELIFAENKGFISVIEMDEQGNYKEPVIILEKEYHLSFPFIIEDNGEIYMIPESKQNNDIQLYKCIEFPYKWQLEKVLIDNVMAVDTIITKENGKYWLFTNLVEYKGASLNDELFLFSSDTLISSNWKPHPANPIVTDVKLARMAGKIYKLNDTLHRPAQNCSKHYGYGMQINQIIELDENRYRELEVDLLYPNWDKKIIATHSLTSTDSLTVIDAQLKRRK